MPRRLLVKGKNETYGKHSGRKKKDVRNGWPGPTRTKKTVQKRTTGRGRGAWGGGQQKKPAEEGKPGKGGGAFHGGEGGQTGERLAGREDRRKKTGGTPGHKEN